MSLSRCRSVARALHNRNRHLASSLQSHQRCLFSDESSGGGKSSSNEGIPYRPWPMDYYSYPDTAKYWSKRYPSVGADKDEYEKEELYLDEIEARMIKYDKRYRNTDEWKQLNNEFGLEDQDDRAFYYYGSGLGAEPGNPEQFGRGKKIDPAHYVHTEVVTIHRNPVPPVEFMTAAQVRRARGALAIFRELPPESPSIWKYWNGYSTVAVLTVAMSMKEWFLIGGHDVQEAILTWSFFGLAASICGDWLSWIHAVTHQEDYDREFFALTKKVEHIQDQIGKIATYPMSTALWRSFDKYRDSMSERVLQRTVSNKIGRVSESTIAKLKAKLSEEQMTRSMAEKAWQKTALDQTMDRLSQQSTKDAFMADALAQFTAGDTATIAPTNNTKSMESSLFSDAYLSNFDRAKKDYIAEQESKGSLSAVFRSTAERDSVRDSPADRLQQYQNRVAAWSQGRNAVNAPIPTFA